MYHLNFRRNINLKKYSFFLIRGFPKSGTNWLGNLMNLHPQVCSCGEFGFSRLAEAREHINQVAKWTVCHNPAMKGRLDTVFEKMIKELMLEGARLQGTLKQKKWIGDKTPGKAYPPTIRHSRCLYIVRDVRDVTVSRAYHLLRIPNNHALEAFPVMLDKKVRHSENLQYFKENPECLLDDLDWVRDNARAWAAGVGQLFGETVQTLQNIYPDYKVQIVRYEDLHANVEAERSRCYRFLDLAPEIALPLDSGKYQTSPGFKEENPQAFYRKGAVGDWKNYFNPALEAIVLAETEPLLKALGYLD